MYNFAKKVGGGAKPLPHPPGSDAYANINYDILY